MFYITSSDLKSANAAIAARGGFVHALTLIPAAAASAVTLYDNTSAASGKVLAALSAAASGSAANIVFNHPVCANTGIYASVSGTGATYIVHYSLA